MQGRYSFLLPLARLAFYSFAAALTCCHNGNEFVAFGLFSYSLPSLIASSCPDLCHRRRRSFVRSLSSIFDRVTFLSLFSVSHLRLFT